MRVEGKNGQRGAPRGPYRASKTHQTHAVAARALGGVSGFVKLCKSLGLRA